MVLYYFDWMVNLNNVGVNTVKIQWGKNASYSTETVFPIAFSKYVSLSIDGWVEKTTIVYTSLTKTGFKASYDGWGVVYGHHNSWIAVGL